MANQRIHLKQFSSSKEIIALVYKIIERNHLDFNVIADASGEYKNFLKDPKHFLYADINPILKTSPNQTFLDLKSCCETIGLNDLKRGAVCSKNKDLLLISNLPYDQLKISKQTVETKNELVQVVSKLDIECLNAYLKLDAKYLCVLHPLAYLIDENNFNQLQSFNDHYKLIDGEIVDSKCFPNFLNVATFPIVIALYQKNDCGMTYDDIRSFNFKINNSRYGFALNQFHFIEEIHNKDKDKSVTKKYLHFNGLSDMEHLSSRKGWLKHESYRSLRVKGEYNEQIFTYLNSLKFWFAKNKKEFWFLGNLSPIIDFHLINRASNLKDVDFDRFFQRKLLLTNSTLEIFPNHLAWKFFSFNHKNNPYFISKKEDYDIGSLKQIHLFEMTDDDYLSIRLGYVGHHQNDVINGVYQLGKFKQDDKPRFVFYLIPLILWGLNQSLINTQYLEKILMGINNITPINQKYYLTKNQEAASWNQYLDAQIMEVRTPWIIKKLSTDDIFSIQLNQNEPDHKGVLTLLLAAQNISKDNKPILDELLKKDDTLTYCINKNRYPLILDLLLKLFATLSYDDKLMIIKLINEALSIYQQQHQITIEE